MSTARLPINHGDTGKVSRDKINDSFNDVVNTVASYRPHIEAGYWWIGDTNTGIQAEGYETEFRVEDGYIQYKSEKSNVWNDLIAIADLKGDKGDQGEKGDKGDQGPAATITVGSTSTGAAGTNASVTNSGTSSAAILDFTIPKGDKGTKGDQGVQGEQGPKGDTGDQGEQGPKGDTGETGNGIASVTSSKVGKTTTVTITETNGDDYSFEVEDGIDGQGAGDVVGPDSSTDGNVALFDGVTGKLIKDSGKALPSVIDNLNSSSSTDALSAAQGKALNDRINDLFGQGKFLSLWNCTTGQPLSFPFATPYTYSTGDYYMVEVVGTTNYRPNGSSYTGTASSTAETDEVEQGDVYIYDGSVWLLQSNHGKTVTFANIAGQPADNTALSNALNAKQDTLTAGVNIDLTSNKVSANNYFLVTEDIVTVSTDATKGVAPYSTSYGYTNIDIDASSGITWKEGAVYTFDVNTEMVVASAYRNVRVKIGSGAYIPVMGTTSILTGSSYFTKANMRQYQYSTKYQSGGALHLFTDSNTTYSAMTAAEATTGTATSGRSISASVLKGAIETHAPVQSVNGQTGAVTVTIPTVNDATLTIQKNGTNVQTFTANQSTNATANITVPTDTADLTNGAGFLTSSTGVTSVNSSTGAVTVSEFAPGGTATTGYVVTKTANGYEWQAPTGGIQLAPNSTYTIKYHWYGTQAEYEALNQYYTDTANDTAYFTI